MTVLNPVQSMITKAVQWVKYSRVYGMSQISAHIIRITTDLWRP